MTIDTEGELVTKEAEILRMFRQAKEQRAPISLVFPNSHVSLSTFLVDLKPSEGVLVLDEPMPRVLSRHLASGETFSLETYFDGVRLRVRALQARSTGTPEEPQFECAVPSEVYHLQRRQSFRAFARRSLIIDARVINEAGETRYGLLRDMSVEGCRLEFNGDMIKLYRHEDEVLAVELTFPDETQMSFRIQILRTDYDDATDVTGVGGRFLLLDAQTEGQVSAVVSDLQRDHINFVKKGGNKEDIPDRFLLPSGEVPLRYKAHSNKSVSRSDQEDTETSSPDLTVDIPLAWRNLLAAVHKQLTDDSSESVAELIDALRTLNRAWRADRQALLVHSRIRSGDNAVVDQRLASSLVQADHQVRAPSGNNANSGITPWMTHSLLRGLGGDEQPMGKLIGALDRLAYKTVGDRIFYRPTAALGVLHKQQAFEARLIQQLIATQGLYPLGSCVRLSNGCAGLVLRQNDKNQPSWVRQLYKLSERTPLPPKDIDIAAQRCEVTGPADPVKLGLSVELLRPALRP